jgi:uncharacterized protein (DUF1501 family)
MLRLLGPASRYCDGTDRRSFLLAGGLAVGGLTLPALLRAEQASGRRSHKSVIMVYLSGGLAHQDTFDPKPDAPAEVRGEFNPLATSVPGVRFTDQVPMLAARMDKLVLLRSIVGLKDEHSSFQNITGFGMDQSKREGRPHFGSVVAKVQGPTEPAVPPFVDLFPTMQHRPYNSPGPGHLGRAAAGVRVDGQDVEVMKPIGVTAGELADRRTLLDRLDAERRSADRSATAALDVSYQRAFDVLTSSKLVEALDVTKESSRLRDRYGHGSPKHLGDGAPLWNDQLLMARRLVEAGSRVVTVAYGFWDTHGQNFRHLKQHLPTFDRGISALLDDIHQRGLDKDVLVVVWGEFGRTPKINKDAGRDHWSPVNSALLFGGGLNAGQVIGTTDSRAAYAADSPVPFHDVLATVYRHLNIDPHAMVTDISGRPTPILPSTASPIDKLF